MVNSRGFDALAGLALGAAALGALRIAGQTVLLLIEMTVGPLTAVAFTLLARSRQDSKLFAETLTNIANVSALLIFPAFAGLYVIADPLLPLLFGSRWAPAAGLAPYMCAIAPALYLQLLVSAALFASGRSGRLLQWAVIEAAATVLFGLIAAPFGLVGLAAAGTLRLYLMAPLGWRWLRRDAGVDPAALITVAAPSMAASVAMAFIVALAKSRLEGRLPPTAMVAILIAVGVTAYALMAPFTAARLIRVWLPRGRQDNHRTHGPGRIAAAGWLLILVIVTSGRRRVRHAQRFLHATEGDIFDRSLSAFRATAAGAWLLERRPNSMALFGDRAALGACPDGSLGRAYFDFVTRDGLDESFYADLAISLGASGETDAERLWYRARIEVCHDLRHLLSGYGVDELGEVCLLIFRYGQLGHKGALVLAMLGFMHPRGMNPRAMVEAYRRGRDARLLDLLAWEDGLCRPLAAHRAALGLAAPVLYQRSLVPEAYLLPQSAPTRTPDACSALVQAGL